LGSRRWEFEVALRRVGTGKCGTAAEVLGLQVERLVRTRFGPVSLGKLASGVSRPLTARERILLVTPDEEVKETPNRKPKRRSG
jgi:hypothetical protein